MAVVAGTSRENIDAAVEQWRDRCLLEDGSLVFEGETVWTTENLTRLYDNVVGSPLVDNRSFIEKFRDQLGGERELALLGAEIVVVYYLFAWKGAVSPRTKRARVKEILDWTGEALPEDGVVWRALGESGIGHPGQYFLLRPDVQLGFVAEFARRLKGLSPDDRIDTLTDPWKLRDFMDTGSDDGAPGMRHIVLHLLHPESFERIASGAHKQSIAATYASLVPDSADDDLDERLLAIRKRLEDLLEQPSERIDFYEPPLWRTWASGLATDGTDPLTAIGLKRQLVFFGPPGTSKTYEAKQLAERIIRQAALKQWGAASYFQRLAEVEQAVDSRIRRLQLHPAYSYEEFIRGLRLRDGRTTYENGYLLRLVEEIDADSEKNPSPLPWVLILDELNRADLSRVFGEAFSVLEDRGSAVDLPGAEPDEPIARLELPRHLYVIGTMNLIDQSLEQIDFALRRRFLWFRSGFDSQRLSEVLPELWSRTDIAGRHPWSRFEDDADQFLARAELLNQHIAESALLGRDYEIGHTYFFDIVGLLSQADHLQRKRRPPRYMWTAKGEPLQPVRDLWTMSLEPLLDQYLQGVDAENRRIELERLRHVFFRGA